MLLQQLASSSGACAAVARKEWGQTPGGQRVDIYTLSNGVLTARISTYGAALVGLDVPDSQGRRADIVRGFDSLTDTLKGSNSHVGAIIGRYANRIKSARFSLDGREYRLAPNSQGNYINGGQIGFDKRVWKARTITGKSPALELSYTSWDGEMNLPGTLLVRVTYSLKANALAIDYRATTDKTTVLNLTNHAYFNLHGAENGDILDHRLTINADTITLSDADGTANGRIATVAGGPFDFRRPTLIGTHIDDPDPQIAQQHGYDQNYILNGPAGSLRFAALLFDPVSGRAMEIFTTQPGLQLYTANAARPLAGKAGAIYRRHGAVCLETQHFANSPNIESFPDTTLRPGRVFHERSLLRFSNR
jgi:aldose 1-epimerase